MDITAVVVARAGSKRLPGKALLPFAGSTLVGHKVRTLKKCPSIARVIIGSDSEEILVEGAKWGAIPLCREAVYCDEVSRTANDMLVDVATRVHGEVIVWAHPTNPLVEPATYEAAIDAYLDDLHEGLRHDSLASVAPMRRHAWWQHKPLNHFPWGSQHQIGSALTPVLFQDGAIFIQSRQRMIENRNFYGENPHLFEMDPVEATDIDTEADYVVAKALWQWRENQQ